MTDSTAMGRTIREARLARGMSLSQLASAVGRSSSSVRRWERGEVPPAIGIIDDLAEALDLDPEQLRSLRPATSMPETAPSPSEPGRSGSGAGTGGARGASAAPLDLDRVPVVAPPPEPEPSRSRPSGFVADVIAVLRGMTESWQGWIRGLLTAGVLIVMAIVLVWVLAELAGALAEIWDSFDAGGA